MGASAIQKTTTVVALVLSMGPGPALAEEAWDGFLCCNYRHDPDWMSDSNYAGRPVMAVGTPVRIVDYGRNRVITEMNGKKIGIGNEYSRSLSNLEFARRMVVREDPKLKIASYPARIQQAIGAQRLVPGMTKEQVLMSIGYPITSENPTLDAPVWRYWLSSFEEFQVIWDKDVVSRVTGPSGTVARVFTADQGALGAAGGGAPSGSAARTATGRKAVLVFASDSSRPYEVLGDVRINLDDKSVHEAGSFQEQAQIAIREAAIAQFGDRVDAIIAFTTSSSTAGGFWGQVGAAYGARNTSVTASGVAVKYK